MQLVDDNCVMWDAMRDKVYGVPEVELKFGVPPAQVRDLLALVGDTSDNVPGVPGVGVKTAAELMKTFGDLDGVYANLEKIKKQKIRESLISHEADAKVSRQLVTLRDDVPVTLDPAALRYDGGDVPRLRQLFTMLGFTRQVGQLPREERAKPAPVDTVYRAILDEAELDALARELRALSAFSVVLHTTPEDAMRCGIVGVAIATAPGKAVYIPVGHRYLGVPKQIPWAKLAGVLGPLLADAAIAKVGHDTKRVDVVLRRHGITLANVSFDAMLASYLLDPEVTHDLVNVTDREVGLKVPMLESVAPKQRGRPPASLEELPVEDAVSFAASWADAALRVAERTTAKLAENGLTSIFDTLEMPLSFVLADLEERGVLVDPRALGDLGEVMSKELAELEEKAREASGHPELNVASPKQLEAVLFDELGLKAVKKTKNLEVQVHGAAAVGPELRVEDAFTRVVGLDRPNDDRAGGVAEQDHDVAPPRRVVERVRVQLGSDDEDATVLATANEVVGHLERVEKPRALLPDVEARAAIVAVDAEPRLEKDGRPGEVDVRRERRQDDAIDLLGVAARVGERPLRRPQREVAAGRGLVVGDVAALLDACARPDPLVARVGLFGLLPNVAFVEVGDLLVRHDAFRNVRAQAENLGAEHSALIGRLRGAGHPRSRSVTEKARAPGRERGALPRARGPRASRILPRNRGHRSCRANRPWEP